jgi:hypothetical protein
VNTVVGRFCTRRTSTDEIAAALDSAGPRPDRAVVVPVVGAGGMGEKGFETVAQVRRDEIVSVAERRDAQGTVLLPSAAGGVRWPTG